MTDMEKSKDIHARSFLIRIKIIFKANTPFKNINKYRSVQELRSSSMLFRHYLSCNGLSLVWSFHRQKNK